MADSKIVRHFQKGLSQGFSREHVRESLISRGFPKQEVEIIDRMLSEEEQPVEVPRPASERGWNPWYLVLTLVIIALLFWVNLLRSADAKEAASVPIPVQPSANLLPLQQESVGNIRLIQALAGRSLQDINPDKEQITEDDLNAARERLLLINDTARVTDMLLESLAQDLR